jgi:hypothetical protein
MSFRTGLASTLLCTLFLLSLSIPCPAQNATCTHWAFFNKFAPADINYWHTIVGSAQQSNGVITGYIRLFNGDTTTYNAPKAAPPTNWTFLTRRNANGATVGWYRDANQIAHGLFLWANKTTTTDDRRFGYETILYGINDFGTMVGISGDFSGGPWSGFKLKKNGTITDIRHPNAFITNPMSINNGGVIVGWYVKCHDPTPFPYHGFIFKNNTYRTIDYPGSDRTMLNDINNYGVIAGTHVILASGNNNGASGGFIYANGTFKNIVGPNFMVTGVNGINDGGYITGVGTNTKTGVGSSFTARCQ